MAQPSLQEEFARIGGAGDGFKWTEEEDEAHGSHCVSLRIPLPMGVTAKELKVELHMRTLTVCAGNKTLFRDRFAEERWLSLEDSYWEFEAKGPAINYFLVKNAEFQTEPIYVLFDSELLDEELPEDKSQSDGDAVLPDEEHCQSEMLSASSTVFQPAVPNHRAAACKEDILQVEEAVPTSVEGCDVATRKEHIVKPVSNEADTEPLEAISAKGMDAVPQNDDSIDINDHGIHQKTETALSSSQSCSSKATNAGADNENCTSQVDGVEHWSHMILRTAASWGSPRLSSGQRLSLCILEGDVMCLTEKDYSVLCKAGYSRVDVSVVRYGQPATCREPGVDGLTIRVIDGCKTFAQIDSHVDFVCVPSDLLPFWFYMASHVVYSLVKTGAVIVVAQLCHGRLDNAYMASSAAILQCLQCKIHWPSHCKDWFHATSAARRNALEERSDLDQAVQSNLTEHFLHACYVPLRHALSGQGFDFRPLYPSPNATDKGRAAAAGAMKAWQARGASVDDAAVAAGIACAESVLVDLWSAGVFGTRCIHEAVCKGVEGVLEARGSEHRAAAVGALLGMREGLYAWVPDLNLESHGAGVASVVAAALAAGQIWKKFSEDVRRTKISGLIRAGGLNRPGECTIALCQALLGVNRPKGGSRLTASLGVLRQVSHILLAAALLPNLLDPNSREVSDFGSVVLESINSARLAAILQAKTDD